MNFTKHPLWLAGFRPFFILTCLAGMILPLWWALIFTGAVPPAPTFVQSPLRWHAHEMFYGFGWALLGGFLLTASKNWVGVRGWHGGPLACLAAAWLLDRIAMSFGAGWPPVLFWSATLIFPAAIVAMLLWTLYVQRVRGQASDNYFFWIILPLFLPAKLLLLEGDYLLGWSMTLALFRVAFLVMLERTQAQFMRHAFQVDILLDPRLDLSIKWLAVLLVFAQIFPAPLAGALEILLALLLLYRFLRWHPHRAFTRLDIGVMYFGYLCIILQLLVSGLDAFVALPWVGSVGVHLFAVGAMGVIVPGMIVRISNGHTGRNVQFGTLDKFALWLMIAGFAARVVMPQFHPAGYAMWLHLTATCWLVAFGLLLWRYAPFLIAPRVDGREH